MKSFIVILAFIAELLIAAALPAGMTRLHATNRNCTTPILTRQNRRFILNRTPVKPFGLRAANVLHSDVLTQEFLNKLDLIKSHGMQSVNISLQGGRASPARDNGINAFNADGSIKPQYEARLRSIINAMAERKMVAVITYYYQSHDWEFQDAEAIINAATNATTFLKNNGFCNVWIYAINEYWVLGFSKPYGNIFQELNGQQSIYGAIKAVEPALVTYVSDEVNDGFIAQTGLTASNGDVMTEYRRMDDYGSEGVFTPEEMSSMKADALTTMNKQGYWFMHAIWHQALVTDANGQYVLPRLDHGGNGSVDDPGTEFIWDYL